MEYRIDIDIDTAEIGCSPQDIRIVISDSREGAKKLFKFFESKFPKKVRLSENTSQIEHTYICGMKWE